MLLMTFGLFKFMGRLNSNYIRKSESIWLKHFQFILNVPLQRKTNMLKNISCRKRVRMLKADFFVEIAENTEMRKYPQAEMNLKNVSHDAVWKLNCII